MRRPDLRIRVQLTVSVGLFTVVCVISLAVAIYVLSRDTLLNIQSGNLDLNCRMLQEECRQEFDDIFETFYRLSYSTPVQRIYENYTNSDVVLNAANVLHDSFGPDRILLLKLYLKNGTEILEVDSRSISGETNLPQSILPISNSGSNLTNTLKVINEQYGLFMGPEKTSDNFNGASFVLSLSLPIRNDSTYSQSGYAQVGQSSSVPDSGNNTTVIGGIIGYATFLVNCQKLERTLNSISQGSNTGSNETGAAALCVEENNFTDFRQLIPFQSATNSTASTGTEDSTLQSIMKWFSKSKNYGYRKGENFKISPVVASKLRDNKSITAVNKGPNKSMISVNQFTVLYSTYYVVVLQSHDKVFSMLHSLRRIIIISSSVIGAGMIIFTFLFVSFGARQILRLKMAATYEQPTSSKWKFLTIPWWLRPSNRTRAEDFEDKSEFRVPEQVPLRKHVRDELDDITERFNTMSSQLRNQYMLLEYRVETRKKEIEQAREAADLANAAKSHFLARVTHELRTPLNGIILTACVCMNETDIETIHNHLRIIFKCGELLLHLMTDLLSFSQNDVENLDLELREFALPEIASQIKAIFTDQCANKKIKLSVEKCCQYSDLIFSGDTNRISQVVFNLMSNGIKFTPEGGEVKFYCEVKDDLIAPGSKLLTFYVEDNGPGIAPEMQSRVFEAFVQGDISKQIKKAGVGLGLSICKQLAERMDGSISLVSELGKGSTFIFELPLTFRYSDGYYQPSHAQLDTSSLSSKLTSSPYRNGGLLDAPASVAEETSPGTDASGEATPKASPQSAEKPAEAQSKRSVFTRTFSSTSQLTRGLLSSSRRRTQESIFRAKDIPKGTNDNSDHSNSNSTKQTTPEPKRSISRAGSITPQSEKNLVVSTKPVNDPSDSRPGLPRKKSLFSTGDKHSPVTPVEKVVTMPFEQTDSSLAPPIPPVPPVPRAPSLPVSPSQPIQLALPDVHNVAAASEVIPRPPITTKKSFLSADIKVLVVDDNSVNQEVMVRMLNLEKLKKIKVANDGLDAIEKVREALEEGVPFDVIFMDVQMPNMDGRQATRIMRQEMNILVPIVAVSAFANEKNADDCLAAGMDLFLSKPLRRPHLRQILRSLTTEETIDKSDN